MSIQNTCLDPYDYFWWEKIFDKYNIFDWIKWKDKKYYCIIDLYYELWYIDLHHIIWWNLSKKELDKIEDNNKYILTKTLEYIKPFIQKWIITLKVLKKINSDKEIWDYLKNCRDSDERKYLINFLREWWLESKSKNFVMFLPEKIFTKNNLDNLEELIFAKALNPNTLANFFWYTTENIQIELTPECREAFEKERKERNEK